MVNKKSQAMQEWVSSFAKFIADENLKLLKAKGDKKGDKVTKALVKYFLRFFIRAMIRDVLPEPDLTPKNKEKSYAAMKQNFMAVKIDVQDAVSQAFYEAIKEYTGTSIDYYCQITPIPDPKTVIYN